MAGDRRTPAFQWYIGWTEKWGKRLGAGNALGIYLSDQYVGTNMCRSPCIFIEYMLDQESKLTLKACGSSHHEDIRNPI